MVKNLFFLIGLLRNFIKIWSFFFWVGWFGFFMLVLKICWFGQFWSYGYFLFSDCHFLFLLKKLKVSKLRLCWSHGLEIITWWSLFVLENVSYFLSILTMIELNDWCI
jgi:hypothetical protein